MPRLHPRPTTVGAEAASVADEGVAETAFTAAEVVAEAASLADEVVAKTASTADDVVAETATTAAEDVAEAASTADEVRNYFFQCSRHACFLLFHEERFYPLPLHLETN